jgi:hypothetical protein
MGYLDRGNTKDLKDLLGPGSQNLQAAIADLKKAWRLRDKDIDALHDLANAQRYLFAENKIGFAAVGEEARSNYAMLSEALREKQWTPWPSAASLLGEHSSIFRLSGVEAAERNSALESEWTAGGDAVARSTGLIFDAIRYGMLADQMAGAARKADGSASNVEPGDNYEFAFSLALLANRLMSANRQLAAADDCDREASNPYDPLRRALGVKLDEFEKAPKFETAKKACEAAHKKASEDPHAAYLLARVLSSSKVEKEKATGIKMFGEATNRQYAMAFNNLSAHFPKSGTQLRLIYQQVILKNHFVATYRYLLPRVRNDHDRDALR